MRYGKDALPYRFTALRYGKDALPYGFTAMRYGKDALPFYDMYGQAALPRLNETESACAAWSSPTTSAAWFGLAAGPILHCYAAWPPLIPRT
jgi:hypothetical protein